MAGEIKIKRRNKKLINNAYSNSLVSSCQSSYKQVRIILIQIYHGQTDQTECIIGNLLPKKIMDAVYFELNVS